MNGEEVQNNDKRFDIDLSFGQMFEVELIDALIGKATIEVKTERDIWRDTGNIYIEYKSRGKFSGISTTEAKYFFIFLSTGNESSLGFMMKTTSFRAWIQDNVKRGRFKSKVKGGDDNTSLGVLVPINVLHEVAQYAEAQER